MRPPITVARISVTPLKATGLHHPTEVQVGPRGVVGDRAFFIVDADGRLFVGSRCGALVTLSAHHDRATDHLRVTAPGGTTVEGTAPDDGEPLEVSFYGRPVQARLVPGPWDAVLSSVAGTAVRLARPVTDGDAVDDQPVTLVGLASVEELARREGHLAGLDPRRFRMTFDLDGCEPFEEDSWTDREVRIGDAVIRVGEQVPRCVVTTQDPRSGAVDFPTLAAIERHRGVTSKGKLPFGVYASVIAPGRVRIGDVVAPD